MTKRWDEYNPLEQPFVKEMNKQQVEAMEMSRIYGEDKFPKILKDDEGVLWWDKAVKYVNGKRIIHKCPMTCHKGQFAGQQCPNPAGMRTEHEGVGVCQAHGGNKRKGRALSAWILMHSYAKQMNTSPWDALLSQIRLLAGQVAFLTQKVGIEAQNDDDLKPDGNAFYWMELLEERGNRLAKVSKMAIDAGIAERMITLMEDQANILHKSVQSAAIKMNLSEDQQFTLLETVARNFQALESGNAIEGEIVHTNDI